MKLKNWLHLKNLYQEFLRENSEIKKTKNNQIRNRLQKLTEKKKRIFYQKLFVFNAKFDTKNFFQAVREIKGKNEATTNVDENCVESF